MFETAAKKKMAVMLLPVGLVFGLTAGAVQADKGFVSGKAGGVKNNYGECWTAVGGVDTAGECGAKMEMADGDADKDGVPDSADACPNTPAGAAVYSNGCPRDSDGDGVPDYKDNCPGTPTGTKVDGKGCGIMADLSISLTADHFAFDSADLKPAMEAELDDVAAKVKASKGDEMLQIVGHTDSTGPEAYNQNLSERRAQSAADYLISQGVPASRITIMGMGESSPVADNSTREGRAANRRVEVLTN
jgi:OOP family OmpA-OmpF porin